jgi:predicted SAM-dependent methyltransferase
MTKQFLNLGCGDRFHPDWENVDMYPYAPGVRVHDLTKKLPYGDEEFDAVYHSHVLEHFPKKQGVGFIRECHRLLKSGGVIRVAVPDLEQIARLYLESLEKASKGMPGWADNYEWMVMEMYDQCIREDSWGALVEYLSRNPVPNLDFVVQRWGVYSLPLIESIRKAAKVGRSSPGSPRFAWSYVLRNPGTVLRTKLVRLLLGQQDWEALHVGRFRRAGHLHLWMYDSYSLGKLLEKAGFKGPQRVGPVESRIPGWAEFHLDTDPDGQVYKADSMYMEAVKP